VGEAAIEHLVGQSPLCRAEPSIEGRDEPTQFSLRNRESQVLPNEGILGAKFCSTVRVGNTDYCSAISRASEHLAVRRNTKGILQLQPAQESLDLVPLIIRIELP